MYADDELTYVQQLESRIKAFEKMDAQSWKELGEQDKTIDALTARIAKLQRTVMDLVDMLIDVTVT